jgi:hypothetical protein
MERMTASLKLECQRRKQLERDSLSCAWGHVLRYDDNGNGQEQRVFYSVSSAGKNDPHRIVLGNVHVPYQYTCPPEEVERGTFPAGGITMDSFISHMGEVRLFLNSSHLSGAKLHMLMQMLTHLEGVCDECIFTCAGESHQTFLSLSPRACNLLRR